MFDLYFAPRKDIRIPESGKLLLVGSGIRENFDIESGIQGFGIQNRAQVPYQGMKSRIQVPLEKTGIQHPESWIETMEWDPESKTVLYSLTWGDSTGLWTTNYYFPFIYLP